MIYRVTTAVFALSMFGGGAVELAHLRPDVQRIVKLLDYPLDSYGRFRFSPRAVTK
jgi:hypothetical protein